MKRFPEKDTDYFGARLRQRDDDDVVDQFVAVSYNLTTRRSHLAATGEYVLAQCSVRHSEKPELFEYRGGRLLCVLFPEFTAELEGYLEKLLVGSSWSG